jgi:hypothetical protein
MRKPSNVIMLTAEERKELGEVVRTRTAPFRKVQRARLVLLAADGMANKAIAQEVGLSRAMVVRRRQRFLESRLDALEDAPRSGKKPRYDRETERRILALLDTDPPWRQALRGLSVTSFGRLRKAIDDFIEAYSQTAHPFEWTKHVVHPGNLKHTYSQL